MRSLKLLAALALLSALWAAPRMAAADPPQYAQVVTSCGTPLDSPVSGGYHPFTMDTTGVLCTKTSGGGGGAITAAAGSYASGALSDGAIVTMGTLADAANCATGQSLIACMRQVDADVKATGSIVLAPTSSSSFGITPSVAGSAASGLVLKASAGNLYAVYVTTTAAGWLMVFNSATVPVDGATTAGTASGNLVECIAVPSGVTTGISFAGQPPEVYSVGISAAFSSTACATKTASATAFIHGVVQ